MAVTVLLAVRRRAVRTELDVSEKHNASHLQLYRYSPVCLHGVMHL
jgi:hypothetical protein